MLCVKQRSESYPDYHGNMNAEVFERCFANTLIPNLQKKKTRKIVIATDNAKYYSRLAELKNL